LIFVVFEGGLAAGAAGRGKGGKLGRRTTENEKKSNNHQKSFNVRLRGRAHFGKRRRGSG